MADEPELTQADYDAADELLEKHSIAEDLRKIEREKLARIHRVLGASRFRLMYGLREPRSMYETWDLLLYHRQITFEEWQDNHKRHMRRSVDAEMLDTLYPQVESRLRQFSKALQAIARTWSKRCPPHARTKLEHQATQRLAKTKKRLRLYQRELRTVYRFLDEVRLECGLGRTTIGQYAATNSVKLAALVFQRAALSWESCKANARRSQIDERYIYSVNAAELFFGKGGPCLPTPQELLALLEEELTAARIALRKRDAASAATATVTAAHATIHVQNADFPNLQVTVQQNSPQPKKATSAYLLSVKSWSELAVGIDEHYQAWAAKTSSGIGKRFPKCDAVRLPLKTSRWKAVWAQFANSLTGNSASILDLAKALGHTPPPSDDFSYPGSRPEAVREENISGMKQGDSPVRKFIRGVVKELNRDLREVISLPEGYNEPCFSTGKDDVRSMFFVRFLLSSDDGVQFGAKP